MDGNGDFQTISPTKGCGNIQGWKKTLTKFLKHAFYISFVHQKYQMLIF